MKVNVIIQIKYVTDIPDDPECYEGANTRKKRIAKEKEYLKEGGDYLFQTLACIPSEIKAKIEPV